MSPLSRLVRIVGILAAAPLGAVAAQTPSPEAMLSRAVAVLDSAETERGAEMLRQLLAMLPPSASSSMRLTALIRLAEASWALGQHDSAMGFFSQAIRQQPFLALDPAQVNPEVVAAFREARRRTPVVGLRVPADTILRPGERWRLRVAVGQPGTVRLYLSQGSKDSLLATSGVDSIGTLLVALSSPNGAAIEPGPYELVGRSSGAEGSVAESRTRLEVTRSPVDTLPHEAPLPPSQLRLESRKGQANGGSLIRGLVFGAAAGAIPALLANSQLGNSSVNARAIAVGATVAVAGLGGAFLGRHPIPITENIDYNRTLRAQWLQRDRDITSRNITLRGQAPIRIRVAGQP